MASVSLRTLRYREAAEIPGGAAMGNDAPGAMDRTLVFDMQGSL